LTARADDRGRRGSPGDRIARNGRFDGPGDLVGDRRVSNEIGIHTSPSMGVDSVGDSVGVDSDALFKCDPFDKSHFLKSSTPASYDST
jgi:hypothetical protein